MGQILHSCATATAALRRTIQNSQESLKQMASRYYINVKTVAKWRQRNTICDLPMDPRHPHSTVLTAEQEALIVAFRRQTLLPLDDCLSAAEHSQFDSLKLAPLFAKTRYQSPARHEG